MGDDALSARKLPTLAVRRREPKGEQRRAALLEALEVLLRDRRLGEISVGELTQAAGVTRPAFYFYFPSKESAVTELLRHVFEEMIDGTQAWIHGEGAPVDTLGAALRGVLRIWRANRHLILAMLDARDDPAVRDLWDSWIELFIGPLTQAVQGDRERGLAPSTVPAEQLVRLLMGMNERALEHHVRRNETEAQAADLAAALTQSWVRVIYGTDPGLTPGSAGT